jgi:hypothetical protein
MDWTGWNFSMPGEPAGATGTYGWGPGSVG